MIKTTPLQTALIAALLGSVALVGCKKKEESTDTNAAPAATAPAEPAPMTGAPPPMAEAAAVSVSTVTVGKTAAADKSVAPAALFSPKDDVIVSVKTDGAANNVNVGAKLTFQDGQVAGEQTATLNASGAETTNVTFKNAKGWPAGKYRAEVTVDGKAAGTPQEFEVK
ncbi:TPA: hypothetical protein ACGW13_003844 [Stenotrophomonas maltophilia]|uniref:hypothetical protein n=1 Tax=Stenotrophomonas TaxID=40323 RepID=UPI00066A9709|nr:MULTISPECIES: hypothetical protein [Stenotrophomonas]EKT4103924.1 hypothetical protein [Stenotrophomonas maltophilia]MBA0262500.1 hypothetical protein [Stenotrophomonas maltophilia]MBA0316487.1 hypothetical protein [Stenotrophomonas maltophilia]MBB1137349.1 hypothetical protein [Stenotrophomonas sp. I18B00994]MBH1670629.1 hypothetical protein [Stenotrophomonas maltophilia]